MCRKTSLTIMMASESVSIPKNPRTEKPVGYAFVDLSTPTEAERAIQELSGKEILERKVSVQLARKPESEGDSNSGAGKKGSKHTDGRGRVRGTRAGRGRGRRGRGGAEVCISYILLHRRSLLRCLDANNKFIGR